MSTRMTKNRNKTDGIAKRMENLKRDAGPGRPLGQRNYATIYKEALIKLAEAKDLTPEQLEEEILSTGLMKAKIGNYAFYKDLLDRLHGTAQNNVNVDVKGTLEIEGLAQQIKTLIEEVKK